jgi:hypothetical protein
MNELYAATLTKEPPIDTRRGPTDHSVRRDVDRMSASGIRNHATSRDTLVTAIIVGLSRSLVMARL